VGICVLDASGSGQGPLAGCYDDGNEPSGSIKDGEFIDYIFSRRLVSWLVG
jgi:hypothetical protein